MEQKRPAIPLQVQAFRRQRSRALWPWVLAAALVVLLLVWLVSRSPGESPSKFPAPVSMAEVVGPPWQMGNPEGRFVLTFYADLECPFCRDYFPLLKRWVGDNTDVAMQWHQQPLAAHEPAASAGARLAECAGEAGGHAAFWQAIEWVYAHTRSGGQGVPDGLRYPGATSAVEQCIESERPDAIVRAQATEATSSGVTATPSLRLQDRQTGRAILLQGPIEGDALLSAMDMLAAEETASDAAIAPATPTSEMPADVVGDMPR